jgi:hypothetical protein
MIRLVDVIAAAVMGWELCGSSWPDLGVLWAPAADAIETRKGLS